MLPTFRSPARRAVAVALVVGVTHAAVVAAVVSRLDEPIDALALAPGGTVGALVGLGLLLGLPTYVAARHRLVTPLGAATLVFGWAHYREFTTPPPTFSTLGGHTVVSGVRYVDGYVDGWYVWLLGALLLGAAEYVARADRDWLPDPVPGLRLDRLLGPGRRPARRASALAAGTHVAVFLGLAADWGYFAPAGFLPSPWPVGLGVLAWSVVGLAVVGGVPVFLLVRYRLVAPAAGLAWLVWDVGWTQQLPLPDDALPVYFLGWFFFAGVLVAAGGLEYGVRRATAQILGRE